ncbi:hypothetical protein ACFL08_03955 [Patescibacteria group bacterium]
MLSAQEAYSKASTLKDSLKVPMDFKKHYGKFSTLLIRIYFQKKNRGNRDTSRDVGGFIFLDLKNHGQIVPLNCISLEARSPREFSKITARIVSSKKVIEYVFSRIQKETRPFKITASELPKT